MDSRPIEAEAAYLRAHSLIREQRGEQATANVLYQLSFIYEQQARYPDVERVLIRYLAAAQGAEKTNASGILFARRKLADVYVVQARYAEAEPIYKDVIVKAEQLKQFGPDAQYLMWPLESLATLYMRQGRFAEGVPLARRALQIAEKQGNVRALSEAQALALLAMLLVHQGKYDEAATLHERSLAAYEEQLRIDLTTHAADDPALFSDKLNVASSLDSVGDFYRLRGRYADSASLLQRSLSLKQKILDRDDPRLAMTLTNLGMLSLAQGRYLEAEPYYKRSLEIRQKALGSDSPSVASSLENLSYVYARSGRLAAAVDYSRRSVDLLGKRFVDAPKDNTDGAISEQRLSKIYFTSNIELVHELGESGAAEETFRVAQLAQASSAARALAGTAARFAAGTDPLALLVRERQDLTQRWQALDGALVKAASEASANRDFGAEAARRGERAEVGRKLDAVTARLEKEFPQYAELSQSRPVEAEAARKLLGTDEALLVYVVDDKESWLWALRADRMAMYRIPLGSKALAAEVRALRRGLDPTFNPDLKPFDAARAYALYQKILAPAASLLDGATRVVVVPDGALEALPLDVLVTAPPKSAVQTPADHRAVAWFARDHAVTTLPSVGSLRVLREFASSARAGAPFAGIGNPTLEGASGADRGRGTARFFRGAMANVDQVRRLPPLPETAEELRAVARAMGSDERDLYLGERASEPQLRRAGLERYQVIEFATQGLMSGDLEGLSEPALVLTPPREASPENDGLLTASKIATFKLNADWVVLSACNTAASDGTPDAGGLSGLAKAFFYAGSRSLLVSHWSVPSQSTVELITHAFENLKTDPAIGRAEALRRARMAMIDSGSQPDFAHPLFWAPFSLVGEGGARR